MRVRRAGRAASGPCGADGPRRGGQTNLARATGAGGAVESRPRRPLWLPGIPSRAWRAKSREEEHAAAKGLRIPLTPHIGARPTETCVREHFAGAQVQSLTNGSLRGADDGAGVRSEVSHSCEPVPKVLPNVRVHEWEHSDSRETVPAARSNPPERRDPYPRRRTCPRVRRECRLRLCPPRPRPLAQARGDVDSHVLAAVDAQLLIDGEGVRLHGGVGDAESLLDLGG